MLWYGLGVTLTIETLKIDLNTTDACGVSKVYLNGIIGL